MYSLQISLKSNFWRSVPHVQHQVKYTDVNFLDVTIPRMIEVISRGIWLHTQIFAPTNARIVRKSSNVWIIMRNMWTRSIQRALFVSIVLRVERVFY